MQQASSSTSHKGSVQLAINQHRRDTSQHQQERRCMEADIVPHTHITRHLRDLINLFFISSIIKSSRSHVYACKASHLAWNMNTARRECIDRLIEAISTAEMGNWERSKWKCWRWKNCWTWNHKKSCFSSPSSLTSCHFNFN